MKIWGILELFKLMFDYVLCNMSIQIRLKQLSISYPVLLAEVTI